MQVLSITKCTLSVVLSRRNYLLMRTNMQALAVAFDELHITIIIIVELTGLIF